MIRASAPGPAKRAEAAETAPNSSACLFVLLLGPTLPGTDVLYKSPRNGILVLVLGDGLPTCGCQFHAAFAGGARGYVSRHWPRGDLVLEAFFVSFYFLVMLSIYLFIYSRVQVVSRSVRQSVSPCWRLTMRIGDHLAHQPHTNQNHPPPSPSKTPPSIPGSLVPPNPPPQGPPGGCSCSAVPPCGGERRAANAATLIGRLGRAVPVDEGAGPSPGHPSPRVFSSSI